MTGAAFLPRTAVLPMCDLVITHGGNNTVTERLHFGKPVIALPLFWDQYDNAQRMHELGFGVRLDTYRFTDAPEARRAGAAPGRCGPAGPAGGRVRWHSPAGRPAPRGRPHRAGSGPG